MIKKNLQTIVDKLHNSGTRVIIQTVPPFNYAEKYRAIWREVNRFIKYELKNAEFVFDCVTYLAQSKDESHKAKYGGHPNRDGCRVWGEALFEAVAEIINA